MLKSKTGSGAQGVERTREIIDFMFGTGTETGGVTGALLSCEVAHAEMDRCHFQSSWQRRQILSPYYVVFLAEGQIAHFSSSNNFPPSTFALSHMFPLLRVNACVHFKCASLCGGS